MQSAVGMPMTLAAMRASATRYVVFVHGGKRAAMGCAWGFCNARCVSRARRSRRADPRATLSLVGLDLPMRRARRAAHRIDRLLRASPGHRPPARQDVGSMETLRFSALAANTL